MADTVTRTEGVCGGEPCIAGTRIPTQHVYKMHMNGADIFEITEDCGITIDQALAAIAYELDQSFLSRQQP